MAEAAANTKKVAQTKDKTVLHVAIYLIIAAMGWFIPPVSAMTPEGMKLLSVFIAAIYGWSICSHVWPSLITFVLLMFTGIVDLNGLIALGWGNDTVMFMILSFVLIAYLEHSGASTFIAAWLLNRKMLSGHPWRLISMLFVIGWLLCTLVNIVAGLFITWAIIYRICALLEYKPYDPFPNLLIFGVAVMGALSLSAVPWQGNALVILGAFTNNTGIEINMLHYMSYSIPVGIFSIIGFVGLCKYVFKLDVSKLKGLTSDFINPEDLKLTPQRKVALIGLGVLIFIIVIPSVLPQSSFLYIALGKMGLTGKLLAVFAVLSIIKVDNEPVFHFPLVASKGIPWNMVMMTVGIMSFVGLLGNPAAGISASLGQLLTPIFADVSVVLFFIITLCVTILLTNFMINMVIAVIMMTATLPIAATLGVDPLQIVYLLTVGCTIAFMLPAASAASCFLFANTAWVRAKDVYRYAFPTIVVMAVITLGWNIILFMI